MTDQPTTWTPERALAWLKDLRDLSASEIREKWGKDAFMSAGAVAIPALESAAAEIERQKARLRVFDGLLVELCSLFGWEDETELHAALHIGNAVRNMQADKATAEEEVERLRAELAAKHPAEAEAAQQGPSDDMPSDAEVAEALGRCYSNSAVHADVWLALQRIARRAGVKL